MSEACLFCARLLGLRSHADLDREVAALLQSLLEDHPDERAFSRSTAVLPPPPAGDRMLRQAISFDYGKGIRGRPLGRPSTSHQSKFVSLSYGLKVCHLANDL